MKFRKARIQFAALVLATAVLVGCDNAGPGYVGEEESPVKTVALWLFDEPVGLPEQYA